MWRDFGNRAIMGEKGEGMMVKRVPWDILLEIIERFPQGSSLEEVMLAMDPKISRRTLQRWLALLVKNNQLLAIGSARARRYKAFPIFEEEGGDSLQSLSFPVTRRGGIDSGKGG